MRRTRLLGLTLVLLAAGCGPGIIGGAPGVDGSGPTIPGNVIPGLPGNDATVGSSVDAGATPSGTAAGTGGNTITPPVVGAVPGTGGSPGSGNLPGTVAPTALFCNVQAILQARCASCHGAAPAPGSPISLVTLANLTARSAADPNLTYAQRALIRVQINGATQMPPPPGAHLAATEILTLSDWISAGYPDATCGAAGSSGATGSGGANGAAGRGGSGVGSGVAGGGGRGAAGGASGPTGNGGATPPVSGAGVLPCAVQTLLTNSCTTCHGPTLVGGATMSLVTYANLTARSAVNAAQTYAQRAVLRMQDNNLPMPPAPGTRIGGAAAQAMSDWIAAGYPSGPACAGGGVGAGAGGAGGVVVPPPDPFRVAARCTSNTFWRNGNSGSASMNPGRACINCHANGGGGGGDEGEDEGGEAPQFTIAGTVYPSAHEPDLCNGVNGTTGARIVIVDAANRTITLTPNGAGNFTYSGALTRPFHAKVTYQGRERIMTAAPTNGDCNGCHTQNGANGAPGRILLP